MTEAPPPPDRPPVAGPASLRVYYVLLLAAGAFITGSGYLWRGLDFAGASLLGFGVIALNFIWTKNLVRSIFSARNGSKGLVVASYLIKFALTAVVLYVAIVRYHVDPVGILFGLTAMLVASLLFAYYVQARQG